MCKSTLLRTLATCLTIWCLVISCRKESATSLSNHVDEGVKARSWEDDTAVVLHPVSLLCNSVKNIRSYQQSLGALVVNGAGLPVNIPAGEWYVNITFAPSAATATWFGKHAKDDSIMIFDWDIASPALMTAPIAEGDTNATAPFKDGLYHCTLPLSKYTAFTQGLTHAVKDTLYLTENTEYLHNLMVHSGLMDPGPYSLSLFRRPEGYIKYDDADLGSCRPVYRIRVWALGLGIPGIGYTDANGWFRLGIRVPWPMPAIVGTEACNDFMKIRPVDVTSFWDGVTTIARWLFGPRHAEIFKYKNVDKINICFNKHDEKRWWAMIINSGSYLTDFVNQDNVPFIPDKVYVWAIWSATSNASSTPMFSRGGGSTTLIDICNTVNIPFGSLPAGFSDYAMGFIPDMLFQSYNYPYTHYTSRSMHTLYHELGHYLHWKRVSNNWWATLTRLELDQLNSSCGGYPDMGFIDGGYVQLAESWAEFCGDRYVTRQYGLDKAFKRWFTSDQVENYINNIDEEKYVNCEEHPYGIFFDLMDVNNIIAEDFDQFGGYTFKQLYEFLDNNEQSICDYINHNITPTAINNGTSNQLIYMVDRNWSSNPVKHGHDLNCWP